MRRVRGLSTAMSAWLASLRTATGRAVAMLKFSLSEIIRNNCCAAFAREPADTHLGIESIRFDHHLSSTCRLWLTSWPNGLLRFHLRRRPINFRIMALLNIINYPDKRLHKVAKPVE